ncbi:MAG: hypothetical protein EXS63_08755 [Candidatus Omnitrophica bacterium]|nr:hypothetical protein [Candidatus Omnitrophota bacterium]
MFEHIQQVILPWIQPVKFFLQGHPWILGVLGIFGMLISFRFLKAFLKVVFFLSLFMAMILGIIWFQKNQEQGKESHGEKILAHEKRA